MNQEIQKGPSIAVTALLLVLSMFANQNAAFAQVQENPSLGEEVETDEFYPPSRDIYHEINRSGGNISPESSSPLFPLSPDTNCTPTNSNLNLASYSTNEIITDKDQAIALVNRISVLIAEHCIELDSEATNLLNSLRDVQKSFRSMNVRAVRTQEGAFGLSIIIEIDTSIWQSLINFSNIRFSGINSSLTDNLELQPRTGTAFTIIQ